MISYLMIIFMATTIAWLDNVIKIKKNFFFKISLFFLAIIAGLRWEFGNDYIAYYSIYNLNSSSIYNNIELGYKILNKVFYNLGFHFNVMLFFIEIINLYLFYKFVCFFSNRYEYYYIYIYMYLITRNYFFSLSGIRQGIAIQLFVYSMIYLYNKSFLKFIVISSLGLFFHKSILIFILFEILTYRIKNKDKINLYLIIFLIIIIFSGENIGFILTKILESIGLERYIDYIKFKDIKFGTGLGFLLKIITIIILLLFQNYRKYKNKDKFILYNIIQYYIFTLFSLTGITLLYRLAPYLLTFLIFLPEVIINKLKNKRIILSFIFIIGIIFFINSYIKNINEMDEKYKKFNDKFQLIIWKKDIYKNKEFIYNQEEAKILNY